MILFMFMNWRVPNCTPAGVLPPCPWWERGSCLISHSGSPSSKSPGPPLTYLTPELLRRVQRNDCQEYCHEYRKMASSSVVVRLLILSPNTVLVGGALESPVHTVWRFPRRWSPAMANGNNLPGVC